MSISRYIRPMSFGETLGSMSRLAFKIIGPAALLYLVLIPISFLGTVATAGPVLIMISNAILGKRLKLWNSIRTGIFSVSFLKIAVLSFGSSIMIGIFSYVLFPGLASTDTGFFIPYTAFHIILDPILIFIPMIMLLEKKGLRVSTKRSFQILRKNLPRITQMVIFISLIYGVMIVLLLLAQIDMGSAFLVAYTLATLTGFTTLPYVFMYYEYRARHENYSEELLTQEMGYQPMEEMMNV